MKRWGQMKKKLIVIVALAALVVLAIPAAFAAAESSGQQAGVGAGPAARPDAGGPLALGLSADQTQQLKNIRDKFLDETKDLRDQAIQIQNELRDLRRSNADQAQIDTKQAELEQNRQALADKALAHRDEIKAILTPEQLSKLQDQAVLGLGLGFDRGWGRGFGMGGGFGRGPGCGRSGGGGSDGPADGSGGI